MALTGTALILTACDRRPDDIPVQVSVIDRPIMSRQIYTSSPAARLLIASTAQGLVRFDASGGIEPGLAERWIVIDGGLSYIFRLREAEWANGSEVTAPEVVKALDRAIARTGEGTLSPYLSAIDEIVAMTPQVIEVRLKRPRPDLLKLFAQPELAIPGPRGTGGSGPFRIQHRDANGVLLRPALDPGRSLDEQPEAPAPEDFVRLRGERAASAILRFAARRSDLVEGGTIADWPMVALADIRPGDMRIDAATGVFGLAIANRRGFLADAANRAAIAAAIDRGALTTAVRTGWAPMETILPERLDSALDPALPAWAANPPQQRLDAAQARVTAWQARHPGPLRLRIALPEASGGNLLWSQIAPMLRGAGFTPERVAANAPADLRLVDRVAPYDSARWHLRTACQPCAEPVARAIEAARDAPDIASRAQALAAADVALAQDVAFIPIASPFRWSLVASRLKAWNANPRAFHPLNHLRPDPN